MSKSAIKKIFNFDSKITPGFRAYVTQLGKILTSFTHYIMPLTLRGSTTTRRVKGIASFRSLPDLKFQLEFLLLYERTPVNK